MSLFNNLDTIGRGVRGLALACVCLAAITMTRVLWIDVASGQTERSTIGVTPSGERAYRANNVGVARLEQFDYEAAVREFRSALEIDPNLVMAQVNLALAFYYANRADEATDAAHRALQMSPDAVQAIYLLGLLARDRNQPDEAVRWFTRTLDVDRDDVGARVNLGQVYLQQRKFSEAIELFRGALAAEPYNVTAAYNLAVALTRGGNRDEGARAMEHFQTLRDSAYGVTYSRVYLEQGKYAEAIVSTGAEPELVDRKQPDVTFVDDTGRVSGALAAIQDAVAVTLIDVDKDADLDLVVVEPQTAQLYLNTRGTLALAKNWIQIAPATTPARLLGVVAGDYDNDGKSDLFVLRQGGDRLLQQQRDGTFRDVSSAAKIPRNGIASQSAAFVDVDHDGDLDIFVAGLADLSPAKGAVDVTDLNVVVDLPTAPGQLLRNNGNGTFEDIASAARVGASVHAVGVVPTDFDNRRDVDLIVARLNGRPILYRNLRDGTFQDDAAEVGLSRDGRFTSLSVADCNKDGFSDLFLGQAGAPGVLATSNGQGRFDLTDAPASTAGANAAVFVDYDNDGLLDLFLLTEAGPRILRNLGSGWMDASDRTFGQTKQRTAARAMALGDLDLDGDTDLILIDRGKLAIWRNDGGNRHQSLSVALSATVSNRSALGSKVEMRAGSLRQMREVISTTPAIAPADVSFGIGPRESADVLRVLWPAGILQAETDFARPSSSLGTASGQDVTRVSVSVTELNRKPSSCPYLYTWNGERFEFVTDFMGGGEMGTWIAPGVRNVPDPDEYVRIRSDQLREAGGLFSLRVTNELEEAVFLDRLVLLAVDHPGEVDVFPNEGLLPPPRPAFALSLVTKARPPAAARDDHGHDVLDRVSRLDRRYPDDFAPKRVRGYAAEHGLVLDLGDRVPSNAVLLLTGWTDYAFSADNVAAFQAGLQMRPPELQVSNGDGEWHTTQARIPFPVGRPQTIVVNLSDLPRPLKTVRLVTSMRIYWDQILIGEADAGVPHEVTHVQPASARLQWRGFSREYTSDGREPFRYIYEQVSPFSPWKVMPGRYTREGDVRDLLTTSDDRFVVARPGDEIAVSFAATSLPPLAPGCVRTFLVYTDGFSKEMDLNSASPDHVSPLPFHGMTGYPDRGRAGDAGFEVRRRAYIDEYNTRVVPRMLPSLELQSTRVTP